MNTIEICAGDIDSVWAAYQGGATRVELCSGLSEGGLTPSLGLIKASLSVPNILTNVLIRPRQGDFLYTDQEVEIMIEDIRRCKELGVNAVVIGALTPEGEIDMDICRRLIAETGDMEVTFHRAFDLCKNPLESIEKLIELGCSRVLTSGAAASAYEGREMLRKLEEQSSGRIIILAGGGVNPKNARQILDSTGVKEMHASARSLVGSKMEYRLEGVSMGKPGDDEYARPTTDATLVSQIVNA